jgi:Ca2+-binding EF-hand superfamily protein
MDIAMPSQPQKIHIDGCWRLAIPIFNTKFFPQGPRTALSEEEQGFLEKIKYLQDFKYCKKAFDLFDLDSSGRLDPTELKDALTTMASLDAWSQVGKLLGPQPIKFDHTKLLDELEKWDNDSNGEIDINEFSIAVYGRHYQNLGDSPVVSGSPAKHRKGLTPVEVKMDNILDALGDMRQSKDAFRYFDRNRNGTIDRKELKSGLDRIVKEVMQRATEPGSNLAQTGPFSLPFNFASIQKVLGNPDLGKKGLTFLEFERLVYADKIEATDYPIWDKLAWFRNPKDSKIAWNYFDKLPTKKIKNDYLKEALALLEKQAVKQYKVESSRRSKLNIPWDNSRVNSYTSRNPEGVSYQVFREMIYGIPPRQFDNISLETKLSWFKSLEFAKQLFELFDWDCSGTVDKEELSGELENFARELINKKIAKPGSPMPWPY